MKQKLKDLLADGETSKAIRQLRALASSLDEDLEAEILMQSNRFEGLNKEKRSGRLSHEQEMVQLAKINEALLGVIKDLPKKATVRGSNTKSILKWVGIMLIAVGLLVSIPKMGGYSLKDLFKKEQAPEQLEQGSNPGQPKPTTQELKQEPISPAARNSNDFKIQTESIEQKTEGDQSPAVIGDEVQINYGGDWDLEEGEEKQDTTKKQ